MPPKFIIYANSFDENNGGAIALHRLCDVLNRLGFKASLWPMHLPPSRGFDLAQATKHPVEYFRTLNRYRRSRRKGTFKTLDRFDTPLAAENDLDDSIVVYPELIDGNPLGAQRVVRWLLHKPGFHSGRQDYGPDDLFFYFQNAFNDIRLNPHTDRLLQTFFVRDDVYSDRQQTGRSGTCHIFRKGIGRTVVHDPENSILIDGLSHVETAAVFNRVKTCISYDLYTMYSMYAAMCGCDSIIVPDEQTPRSEWYAKDEERFGMAYGWEDLAWARQTRHQVLPRFKALEAQSDDMVRRFVEICSWHFA
jgi:hypothetical protein